MLLFYVLFSILYTGDFIFRRNNHLPKREINFKYERNLPARMNNNDLPLLLLFSTSLQGGFDIRREVWE